MTQQTLNVTGMHCGSCALLIDETLAEISGVTASSTSFDEGRTVVDHDPGLAPVELLAAEISKLGYKAEPAVL